MSQLAVHHWPPAAGAALPSWDGELVALSTTVPVGTNREGARATIRAAVVAVIAQCEGIDAGRIAVTATPGSAPRVRIDGADAAIGVSISHADRLSVALLRRRGAVGVDIMQIGLASDWARVAHDYLGMASASMLAASTDAARPLAFCRAWVRREALLKLRGEQLTEWHASKHAGDAQLVELALADGLVGVAAFE